jgi:hypothetical protein
MAKCNLNVCLKVFVVSINTLFLVFGMVLLAGGSYALAAEFHAIDADVIKELGIGLVVVGVFSMLLSIVSLMKQEDSSLTGLSDIFIRVRVDGLLRCDQEEEMPAYYVHDLRVYHHDCPEWRRICAVLKQRSPGED